MAKRELAVSSKELAAQASKNQVTVEKKAEVKQAAPPVNESKQIFNKEVKKELNRQQKLLQQLEEKIGTATTEKNKLEQLLSDPSTYSDKTKFQQTESAYQSISKQLTQLNAEYETIFEKVMELETKVTE